MNGNKNSFIRNQQKATPLYKIDKKKLKEDINILTKNVSKLTENKQFFETLLEDKLKKFIKILKSDMKDSKNTDIVKKCLSLIHKHYEFDPNDPKNANQVPGTFVTGMQDQKYRNFSKNVSAGLQKIDLDAVKNEEKYKKESIENNNRQRDLLMSMNNKEVLQIEEKRYKQISIADVETRRVNLGIKTEKLTKKYNNLKKILDTEIYDLTLNHEKKGRDLMQEKVIELALNSVKEGGEEPETVEMSHNVEQLFNRVKMKSEWIQNSEYDKLMKKKKELEKRITTAKEILKV